VRNRGPQNRNLSNGEYYLASFGKNHDGQVGILRRSSTNRSADPSSESASQSV
jgi:hypothetical protein